MTILSVLSTTASITLTWVPPFSLDITGVDPDFTHTVEVYDITSGGRQEVGIYENITDSIFTFTLCEVESQANGSNGDGMNQTNGSRCTLVNFDPSNLFEFIVTAVNAVGRGKPSEVNATFLQGLLSYMYILHLVFALVNFRHADTLPDECALHMHVSV